MVWDFCLCESFQKIDNIQKLCLRLDLDDYKSNCSHQEKNTAVEIKRQRILVIFKTISNINPSHMKSIYTSKAIAKVHPNDIVEKYHGTTNYRDKSFKLLVQKNGISFDLT